MTWIFLTNIRTVQLPMQIQQNSWQTFAPLRQVMWLHPPFFSIGVKHLGQSLVIEGEKIKEYPREEEQSTFGVQATFEVQATFGVQAIPLEFKLIQEHVSLSSLHFLSHSLTTAQVIISWSSFKQWKQKTVLHEQTTATCSYTLTEHCTAFSHPLPGHHLQKIKNKSQSISYTNKQKKKRFDGRTIK